MSFFMYLKICSEINSNKFEKINLNIVLKITIDNRFLAFFLSLNIDNKSKSYVFSKMFQI